MVSSFGMIPSGLASVTGDPGGNVAASLPFGVLEGMGALFGSLANFLSEEQATLADILRLWAGLFVARGFALVVTGGVTSFGPRP